jgi:hypothetical protein
VTSCWQPQVKLGGMGLAWLSPAHQWIWTESLGESELKTNRDNVDKDVTKLMLYDFFFWMVSVALIRDLYIAKLLGIVFQFLCCSHTRLAIIHKRNDPNLATDQRAKYKTWRVSESSYILAMCWKPIV